MINEKYFIIIKHDDERWSLDKVDTEGEAKEFIQHPASYDSIRIIKGVEMNININPILTVGEEE